MTEIAPRTGKRNAYEANLDIQYAVEVMVRHERLYKRLNAAFTGATILFASAAAGRAIGNGDGVIGFGLAAAIVTAIQHATSPARREFEFSAARKRYLSLAAEANELSLQEIDARLHKLRADDPVLIDAVRLVACNANLRSHGRTDKVVPLPWWRAYGYLA